ncbi:DNA/RNA non-specific endonuclease [Jiangella anatolica]|uniref:Type VII secretion system protein EssD-like domain-containing protein n=1 Tax=Jiangella anatolica TaxID=2670374 RepID=A0A2W2BZJ2_9ACTN|nr:DNA/RNA non-specific endonuclease [Jiangella anatolica]PZF81087.1 hypothetical protein C1I92_22550 [Jiangella anatolica]
MGDRPIRDSAEALRQVRDDDLPRELDGVLEVMRGNAEQVRRLVEQAAGGGPATRAVADAVDAAAGELLAGVSGLGDEVAAALSGVADELTELVRPVGAAATASAPPAPAAPARALPVIHISGTDRKDAKIRAKPPPDHVIVVDESMVYTTDGAGWVVSVDAALTARPPGKRKKYAQRTVEGKLPGDDAGHLIASMLGGIGDKINLTPMEADLNRRRFAKLERRWKRAIDEGKPVSVKIVLYYTDGTHRPGVITVTHTIDGVTKTVKFPNPLPGDPP